MKKIKVGMLILFLSLCFADTSYALKYTHDHFTSQHEFVEKPIHVKPKHPGEDNKCLHYKIVEDNKKKFMREGIDPYTGKIVYRGRNGYIHEME